MAEGKKTNIAMIVGLAINGLLLVFFVYMYYTTIPGTADILEQPPVRSPQIVNPTVKTIIDSLQKVGDLPINLDPSEIGKTNPYSQ